MKIKDIPKANRPRERLLKNGVSSLSDAELLAIILQQGTKNENVVDMANRLIARFGLENLFSLSLSELQEIKGIGPAKSMKLRVLHELSQRCLKAKVESKPLVCAEDVFEYCSPKLSNLEKEYFMVLHLDSKNVVIRDEIVSIGSLNETIIHPREVFKSAVKNSSNSIILVHNHPSGDPTPSDDDKKITEKLFKAGELLCIKVLDHVIVGKNKFYSFKEK